MTERPPSYGSNGRVFVPVDSAVFDRYTRGKYVEVRNAKGRWNVRHVKTGKPVTIRRGYSTADELHGVIGRTVIVRGITNLPHWAAQGAYIEASDTDRFDPNGRLIAFENLKLRKAAPQRHEEP